MTHHDSSQTEQKDYSALISELTEVVGSKNILTDPARTKRYRTGFFYGNGDALAVVKPGSLVEFYKVAKACAQADVIVINQAANTGVTGGSTPWGNDYDRPIVIVNTLRLTGIELIKVDTDAPQAVCHAGSTLFSLEEKLATIGREPHSVIGSSCIGASVVGGVCNNSGGTLVQRGPSFTEFACYSRINEKGEFEFINNLGIDLGDGSPEEQLARLEKGNFSPEAISTPEGKLASSLDYKEIVTDVDADTPSRYNADPRRLKGISGSAGHAVVYAVRVDTFAKAKKQQLFYIGTNDHRELTEIRRAVLTKFDGLPVLGEYLNRETFDDAVKYGKDTFFVLNHLGTKRLPFLFNLKDWYDRNFGRRSFLPAADTILQFFANILPNLLPKRIVEMRDNYEHHLMLVTADDLIEPTRKYLEEYLGREGSKGSFFVATPEEHKKALLHRFSLGVSLVRCMAVFKKSSAGLIALDVAKRRNDENWTDIVPPEIKDKLMKVNCCAHFLCHVFHQDYLVKKGENLEEIKEILLKSLDEKGAEYPAEHNVGHLYKAKESLVKHYRTIDPTNSYNPGVGKQSKLKNWGEPCGCGCSHHHEEQE